MATAASSSVARRNNVSKTEGWDSWELALIFTPQKVQDQMADEKVNKDTVDKPASEKAQDLSQTTVAVAERETISKGGMVIAGSPGFPFNIRGKGFGSKKGTVLFAGRQVDITRWDDNVIKGFLPPDVEPGEVIVRPVDGPVQKSKY